MTATLETIFASLGRIFNQVLGSQVGRLDIDATSQTISGWDSFKYIEIIVALENEFDIELDGPDIDDVRNVGDLAGLVLAKVTAGSSNVSR